MANVLEKALRMGEGRVLRKLQRIVDQVNNLEEDFRHVTDEELKAETVELRERYSAGESLDDLLPGGVRRRPRGRRPHHRPAPLRRAGDGRRGAAPRQHRRDEDR